MLPLAEYDGYKASPCVGSGFCCKKAPCGFGEPVSDTDRSCIHLVEVEQQDGKHPRYTCGIFEQIIGQPGWEHSPAFGAGCCAVIGNRDRQNIIAELRNSDDLAADLRRHHKKHD